MTEATDLGRDIFAGLMPWADGSLEINPEKIAEIDRIVNSHAGLVAALEAVEWSAGPDDDECPECRHFEQGGHYKGRTDKHPCQLDVALADCDHRGDCTHIEATP